MVVKKGVEGEGKKREERRGGRGREKKRTYPAAPSASYFKILALSRVSSVRGH